MNVLITAGGTTERIDTVRGISNNSTGKLGSLIAERFASKTDISKIFYICGKTAIKPKSVKTEISVIDDVAALETAIRETFNHTRIDIIVHAMAVSDYRVKKVTTVSHAARLVTSNLDRLREPELKEPYRHSYGQSASKAVASLIKSSESIIGVNGKISSDVEDMLLLMERTPKIISVFQTISPQSTLIGFKLLSNVSQDVLIDRGFNVLAENKCSYVLANDLKDITDTRHIGYLINDKKDFVQYSSKDEIAAAIVAAAIRERT